MPHPWANRLGRIYVPDERDWNTATLHAAFPGLHAAVPAWTDPVVLDQGAYGTCVGNGWAGWGDSMPVEDSYTETDARAIYFEATCLDGHCDDPDAPGGGQQGSSVRSGAQAMQKRGRLAAYAFSVSLADMNEWLDNHGPVVMGTNWTNGMFTPDANGYIAPTGPVEGGHCYLCIDHITEDGADDYLFRNSWGASWGLGGDFKMHAADVQALLSASGEACFAVELAAGPQPAPDPQPSGCLPGLLGRLRR